MRDKTLPIPKKHWFPLMDIAMDAADQAAAKGEVPVGAVLLLNNRIIAVSGNRVEEQNDPTAHAEILVIREAARQMGSPRLPGAILYVTLEPCALCAAAISFARIEVVYFGAYDPKGGAVDHGSRFFDQATCHHRPQVFGGICEEKNAQRLKSFFQRKRLFENDPSSDD